MGMVGSMVIGRRAERAGGLEELYAQHAPGAVRLAFLLTSDRELARDIAQDAFVKVAGRFRHLRYPDAFDAYLRRTVVNLCTSNFRRAKLEREFLRREAAAPQRSVEPPELGNRDELQRALQRLPIRQRTAIVLRYYEDLPEEEVAIAMRCSVAAARSLISRGMDTLRSIVRTV
jgi:RNA polymerase sigma-70 factor (sigma-E family)